MRNTARPRRICDRAVAVKANINHLLGHADEQKNKAQER